MNYFKLISRWLAGKVDSVILGVYCFRSSFDMMILNIAKFYIEKK